MASLLSNRSRGPSRGFTLTELLMTLAVLGILAAIVMPKVSRSSGSHRVVEQSRRIHADLVEARTRAVAEQRSYRMQFNMGGYWRPWYHNGSTWVSAGPAKTLPDGISFTVDNMQNAPVNISRTGRVLIPRTIVVFDQDGHDQRIEILTSGMIEWHANR